MTDFKKYDTEDTFTIHHARLTDDAKVISEDLVKVTFVSTSRNDKDDDIWIDALQGGGQTNMARHLKKGDVISATGKLTMHRFGDAGKVGFQLRLSRLIYPISLLSTLKERAAVGLKSGAPRARGKTAALDDDLPF